MNFFDLPKHHAVLIENIDRKALSQELFKQLKEISLANRFFDQTVLDIDTARTLVSWAKTPYQSEKVALISFHSIGEEAQNAMLKILEEPPEKVRFVLVTGNTASLLPTFLSRLCQHQSSHNDLETKQKIFAELFIATANTERMKLPGIVSLLKQEDEKGRKDRESVRMFILSLTKVLPASEKTAYYIEEIFSVASFASDPSASSKALLEYLSLLLPQTKV